MTLLIGSVFADTMTKSDSSARQAELAGADRVELRVDTFAEPAESLTNYLNNDRSRNWLVTCRSRSEGGRFGGTSVDAAKAALAVVAGTNAWVDVEFASWKLDPTIQDGVNRHLEANPAARVILSFHAPAPPERPLADMIDEILTAHPKAIAKVAFGARHILDSFPAIDAMHRFGKRVMAIAMGEHGSWTRLVARKLGAFGTFAAVDQGTAMGQFTLQELQHRFHWSRIHQNSLIYGVAGDPVAHSASPDLFNQWFAEHGIDAVYLPFRIDSDRGGLAAFINECAQRPWLQLAGMSVTIPHKEAACRWAGPACDPMSREIGAANCLVIGHGSQSAYNTDSYAAVDSLTAALGRKRCDLKGTFVDVLGCGGSARAICHGLAEMGCHISVFSRNPDKARHFEHWGASVRNWSERLSGRGEVLINCTPVGMWPHSGVTPMPPEGLRGRNLVFDLIYRPLKTRLLADAETAEVPVLGGLDMFIRQAATQFALWTGIDPDIDAARAWLTPRIQNAPSPPAITVALIGARGSGKTTVAARVAHLLGLPHYDTDSMVREHEGKSIREIFTDEGESGFRRLESRAVRKAMSAGPAVISLGGGSLLDAANRAAVGHCARVIWLAAPAEVLAARLRDDPGTFEQRPPLTAGADSLGEIKQVLQAREERYREAADLIIDTEHLDVSGVAQIIIDEILRNANAQAIGF